MSGREEACHASFPGPARLADPNRVRGARLKIRTLYLFFFFKTELAPVGMAHTYNNSKSHIHITESHLLIQNCTFTFTNQSTEPTCSEPLQVC